MELCFTAELPAEGPGDGGHSKFAATADHIHGSLGMMPQHPGAAVMRHFGSSIRAQALLKVISQLSTCLEYAPACTCNINEPKQVKKTHIPREQHIHWMQQASCMVLQTLFQTTTQRANVPCKKMTRSKAWWSLSWLLLRQGMTGPISVRFGLALAVCQRQGHACGPKARAAFKCSGHLESS